MYWGTTQNNIYISLHGYFTLTIYIFQIIYKLEYLGIILTFKFSFRINFLLRVKTLMSFWCISVKSWQQPLHFVFYLLFIETWSKYYKDVLKIEVDIYIYTGHYTTQFLRLVLSKVVMSFSSFWYSSFQVL